MKVQYKIYNILSFSSNTFAKSDEQRTLNFLNFTLESFYCLKEKKMSQLCLGGTKYKKTRKGLINNSHQAYRQSRVDVGTHVTSALNISSHYLYKLPRVAIFRVSPDSSASAGEGVCLF